MKSIYTFMNRDPFTKKAQSGSLFFVIKEQKSEPEDFTTVADGRFEDFYSDLTACETKDDKYIIIKNRFFAVDLKQTYTEREFRELVAKYFKENVENF